VGCGRARSEGLRVCGGPVRDPRKCRLLRSPYPASRKIKNTHLQTTPSEAHGVFFGPFSLFIAKFRWLSGRPEIAAAVLIGVRFQDAEGERAKIQQFHSSYK